MAHEAQKRLLADLNSMRDASDIFDLITKYGDETYPEAENKAIDLNDNDPATIRLHEQYLYEAEYESTLLFANAGPEGDIFPHKYDIAGLKKLCIENLLEKPEAEHLMTDFSGLGVGLLFEKAKQSGWCSGY
ncbi:hypothetical protein E8E12_004577 [Didymella heteroderae]|uniref:Uncharacterized protein n=1 Tax=Didymella heteroderae TaxID=1769908 RepID=A0A9P4WJK1_9PLEO|nr:hypothetical protein E8E12_004577 [Didymella heteroderae]